jgi:Tol biopolymer transport system component
MARILGAALSLVLVAAVAPAGVAAAQRQPDAIAPPLAAAPLPAPPGKTTLVSQARTGGVPNNRSSQPSMSADARFIAYTSTATNIVNGKPSGATSLYVLDRRTGRTDMAPVIPDEQQGAGFYTQPSISDDGRWVAFMYQEPSFAGAQSSPNIALWDRQRDKAARILVDSEWVSGREPAISGDGRYVAFTTDDDVTGEDDGDEDVIRWDRQTTNVVLVSEGFDGGSISGAASSPSISANGNAVAFVSDGGDSVVNADTGPDNQVYVRNIAQSKTTEVSAGPDGERPRDQATDPSISRDGRYVAFASASTNLTPEGAGGIFRHDRQTGRTVMVSVTPTGGAANGASAMPSITSDGAMVAWASTATNMVPETAGGFRPAASVTGAVEVFIRDISAKETVLISVNRDNQKGGSRSLEPVIDGIGRYVAFSSLAVNLVANDDNKLADVFLRDLPPVPVINPPSLDFGAGTVDTPSAPLAATLGNAGWSPLVVGNGRITGTDPAHFGIVADGCRLKTLRRAQACTVTVVFEPRSQGAKNATLAISDSFTGSPRTVRLRGNAARVPNARLEISPEIGQPGIVTIATGRGFPANTEVRLRWSEGITPKLPTITTDAQGRFTVPVLVFHNDRTGPRQLIAEPAATGAFAPPTADMLVTKPTVIPPRFGSLRIIDLPLVLVIRG